MRRITLKSPQMCRTRYVCIWKRNWTSCRQKSVVETIINDCLANGFSCLHEVKLSWKRSQETIGVTPWTNKIFLTFTLYHMHFLLENPYKNSLFAAGQFLQITLFRNFCRKSALLPISVTPFSSQCILMKLRTTQRLVLGAVPYHVVYLD